MASGSFDIVQLLISCVESGAADLHLHVGSKPALRLNGDLAFVDTRPLTPDDLNSLFLQIGGEQHATQLTSKGSVDLAFDLKGKARFRVCVSLASGHKHIVLRRIPHKILPIESLGLPQKFIELIFRHRGLLLITGPTGSGKTTTLASLIKYLSEQRSRNIIMIEEPTEYIIPSVGNSLVTQRQVGTDLTDFKSGLRTALRMDPDVIVVGEMRDPETVSMAITAADTGHLVLGTLHTTSAQGTVDRILGQVPNTDMNFVRANLASSLLGVACQQLVRRADGKGVVAASEIMIGNSGIRAQIRQGNIHQIPSAIQTGNKFGMRLLDTHLEALVRSGAITLESAIEKANEPESLALKLRRSSPPDEGNDEE